jgi:nitroimidazol reductase NimA-like FMN-containing flavoprotein (pyridoxamine 5'-phosphate oxidase superfamily)
MGYVSDEAAEILYMVTLKDSQKYRNVLDNPRVSLLVDTRQEIPVVGRSGVKALTVHGTCRTLPAGEGGLILRELASRHPHLEPLTGHPDAVVLEVKVDGLLLLEGVADAHYHALSR